MKNSGKWKFCLILFLLLFLSNIPKEKKFEFWRVLQLHDSLRNYCTQWSKLLSFDVILLRSFHNLHHRDAKGSCLLGFHVNRNSMFLFKLSSVKPAKFLCYGLGLSCVGLILFFLLNIVQIKWLQNVIIRQHYCIMYHVALLWFELSPFLNVTRNNLCKWDKGPKT
jgi:hypothetical protein